MGSKIFAKWAIRFLLNVNRERLPKQAILAFPLADGSEGNDLPYVPRSCCLADLKGSPMSYPFTACAIPQGVPLVRGIGRSTVKIQTNIFVG